MKNWAFWPSVLFVLGLWRRFAGRDSISAGRLAATRMAHYIIGLGVNRALGSAPYTRTVEYAETVAGGGAKTPIFLAMRAPN